MIPLPDISGGNVWERVELAFDLLTESKRKFRPLLGAASGGTFLSLKGGIF